MKRSGFTLIELLVVIAIIAILAAILFPVFARARENARKSSCQSNLKQIGLSLLQYIQDYDETFPAYNQNGSSPFGVAQPYMKNTDILICPSTKLHTYGCNYSGGFNMVNPNLALAQVQVPAQWIMAVEDGKDSALTTSSYVRFPPLTGNNAALGHYSDDWAWPDGATQPSSGTLYIDTPAKAHFDGANAVFGDGHVKWFRYDKLNTEVANFTDCLWLPY